MDLFKRFNINNSPYAYYDVSVIDRRTGSLVFVSCVGYSSVINEISKELNKNNNAYIEGWGYSRSVLKGYEIEKRKQNNSDFMHMVAYRKDIVTEENDGNDRLDSYIFFRTNEEKIDRVYDKLYKNTAIPILKEWVPYIISRMDFLGYIRPCHIYYDKKNNTPPFDCYSLSIRKRDLIQIISVGLSSLAISINNTTAVSDTMLNIHGLDGYLNEFGEVLARRIQESFVPKFIPGESSYDEKVNDYDDACYYGGIEIYEPQKAVIQASINNLNKNNVTYIIGEMGSGKTLIGTGVTYGHSKDKCTNTVILCPAHLTNKWKREIERLVPKGKAYILKGMHDLKALDDEIKSPNKRENTFLIISKETAKFGYEMRPSVIWSESKKSFVCPQCGKRLTKKQIENPNSKWRKRTIEVPFDHRDMAKQYSYNTTCDNISRVWDKVNNTWINKVCGSSLWVPLIKQDDEDRDWIKIGSHGWIMVRHINEIFENLSSKNDLKRKDTDFLIKLSEKKAELDAGNIKFSSRAPRKYPLAKYIKKYYKGYIDYLIADELKAKGLLTQECV